MNGPLLPGTPGTLVLRNGSGRAYWYRAYQGGAGRQVEDLVCGEADTVRLEQATQEIAFARWVAEQVRALRKLGFQVADRAVGHVLVGLARAGLLDAGLCLVGTLAFMVWLNESGASAISARTQDIDLAVPPGLKLAASRSFAEILEATRMGFLPVLPLSYKRASSSFALAGREGLRVDLLTHGGQVGNIVRIEALDWSAQTIPHYDYLLVDLHEASLMAGVHCIPIRLPALERFIWHKLYSSAVRKHFPEKAVKDLRQGLILATVLAAQDVDLLSDCASELPGAMRKVLREKKTKMLSMLENDPVTGQAIDRAL